MATIVLDETERRREVLKKLTTSELIAMVLELERETVTDYLTGVSSRAYFEKCAESLFHREIYSRYYERRHGRVMPISILFIDVDNFKRCNDMHGHVFGDNVLRAIGKTFKENVRGGDIVARYGGEEFVVLMPDTYPKFAALRAERLREAVNTMRLHNAPNEVFSVSIGVSHSSSANPRWRKLLESADNGCLKAKAQGKNRVVCSWLV